MHEIYELKEMLMKELEEYGRKGELTGGSLDIVDKLAHAIKNLCKIIEAAEEEEYSSQGGGGMNTGGMSGNSYEYSREGNSSRNSGRGGSYARGRGSNAGRDSRGRYSSEGGGGGSYRGGSYRGGYSTAEDDMADMLSELRDMMEELPMNKQVEVRRFIDKIERMDK